MIATYERLLRRRGHRVVSATSRAGGLKTITSERLALLVADVRLPDGDGLDLVRAARRAPGPPAVIVATGYPSQSGRRQAFEAGVSAYLAKPFWVKRVVGAVEQILG